MDTRQAGIEKKIVISAVQIAQVMTPGIPPSPKSVAVAKIVAEATAKTVVGVGTATNIVPFTFTHGLGYIPIITIVLDYNDRNAMPINIIDLTDQIATIHYGGSGTITITAYAH